MAIPGFNEECYLDDVTKKSLGFLEFFRAEEAIAIMLGFTPSMSSNLHNYDWYNAPLTQLIQDFNDNLFSQSKTEIDGDSFNHYEILYIHALDIKEWAEFHGHKWDIPEFKKFNSKSNVENSQETEQIKQAHKRIAELEEQIEQFSESPNNPNQPQGRISQAQKSIFTLLVAKNYPKSQSRNELFSMINAEMKELGITTSDISYATLDKMIDEDIRLLFDNNVRISPFPPKNK